MIAGRAKVATLHPAFRSAVELLLDLAEENGVTVTVTSAFRSIEDQKRVCRTAPGPCATPGRSAHQYGLAIDLVGGATANSEDHKWLRAVAQVIGFGFVANDPVHLEHPAWPGLRKQIR